MRDYVCICYASVHLYNLISLSDLYIELFSDAFHVGRFAAKRKKRIWAAFFSLEQIWPFKVNRESEYFYAQFYGIYAFYCNLYQNDNIRFINPIRLVDF